MGTKENPGVYDCLAKAEPDEPMFILLGRDRFGPSLVDLWSLARLKSGEDQKVVNDAMDVASAMRNWLYLKQKREVRVLQFVPDEYLLAELERRQAMNRMAIASRARTDFAPSAPIALEPHAGEWPAGQRANGVHVYQEPGIPGEPVDTDGGTPD